MAQGEMKIPMQRPESNPMGASGAQIAANRQNAKKSTGPRTQRGKEQVRYNALKHGLLAHAPVLPGEDPEEYLIFQDRLLTEIAPAGKIAEMLTYRLAGLLWRARRVHGFEVALFSWIATRQADIEDLSEHAIDERNGYPAAPQQPNITNMTRGRWLEEILDRGLSCKLARYERHLDRQIRSTVRELEILKGIV